MTDVVQYETPHGHQVTLSIPLIKKFLVSGGASVSDAEAYLFLKLCQFQGLNPFLREAYLIKYGQGPASIVVGKDTFLKRAERHEAFDGFKAGIILRHPDGNREYREGTDYNPETEELVGGWAEVYRKDRRVPFRCTVNLREYEARRWDPATKTWKPTASWERMPGTMIRKVPLVQALREAFPSLGGLYDAAEMQVEPTELPETPVEAPEGLADDAPEGELPEASPSSPSSEMRSKIIELKERDQKFRQLMALWRETHRDPDQLRVLIFERWGLRSLRQLTLDQIVALIDEVKATPLPATEE